MLRGQIVEMNRENGKDTVEIGIRAASKMGAITAARLTAAPIIPLRDQKLGVVRDVSNTRLFDQWIITIRDRDELSSIGE